MPQKASEAPPPAASQNCRQQSLRASSPAEAPAAELPPKTVVLQPPVAPARGEVPAVCRQCCHPNCRRSERPPTEQPSPPTEPPPASCRSAADARLAGQGPSRGAECRAAAESAEPSRAEPTGPLRPGAGGRRRPSAAASLDQAQRHGAATRPAARAGARRQSRLPSRAEGRPRGPLRLRAHAASPRQLIQRARRRTNESSPCSRGTWPRESNSRGTLESSRARG
jgi:hypothetical protein